MIGTTSKFRKIGICEIAGRVQTADDVKALVEGADELGINKYNLENTLEYLSMVGNEEVKMAIGRYATTGCAAGVC